MNRRAAAFSAVCILLGAVGCAEPRRLYEPRSEADRDPARAQQLTLRAAALIGRDDAEAERLLREALAADFFSGPAHNNLGTIYLDQGHLYSAATEFELAAKFLPGHPDPRLNLALTLERAGRVAEALEGYREALVAYEGHLPSMQALARLQVRSGQADEGTAGLLREIALRGESEEWRRWARAKLAAAE